MTTEVDVCRGRHKNVALPVNDILASYTDRPPALFAIQRTINGHSNKRYERFKAILEMFPSHVHKHTGHKFALTVSARRKEVEATSSSEDGFDAEEGVGPGGEKQKKKLSRSETDGCNLIERQHFLQM